MNFDTGRMSAQKRLRSKTGNWISGMPCFREAAMCQGYV